MPWPFFLYLHFEWYREDGTYEDDKSEIDSTLECEFSRYSFDDIDSDEYLEAKEYGTTNLLTHMSIYVFTAICTIGSDSLIESHEYASEYDTDSEEFDDTLHKDE